MARPYPQSRSRSMRVADDAAGAEVESVSTLTQRIKTVLETSIAPCWVRGEVSNLRAQSSGHVYFSLKDAGSQISCVMFRGDAARSGTAGALRDGAQLIVFGEISLYEPRGSYQLIVRAAVDDGVGRLQQEFERLKQRLAVEGLFDAARKKPLPVLPETIGLITSPTGAAAQDFIRILKRRGWRGHLIILPAKVQGDGAAAEMVAALDLAHRLQRGHSFTLAVDGSTDRKSKRMTPFDLLVIGRGGGSLEDLWAFNEEPLVRAVAASRIPIISAVGHEIDFTLTDFAADRRAETPSGAAELISSGFLDTVERVRQAGDALDDHVDDAVAGRHDTLELLRGRLRAVSPVARLEQMQLRLDDLANRFAGAARHVLQERRQELTEVGARLTRFDPGPRLAQARERLRGAQIRFVRAFEVALGEKRQEFAHAAERLAAVGPDSVLKRGFVILRDTEGRPIVSRSTLGTGDHVSAQFHDGDASLVAE